MTDSPPSKKTWFKKQEDALEASEGDILVKWGNFHFTTFKDQEDFMEYILECSEDERQFFEVLKADRPQRMFADLDGEGLAITREQLYALWGKLMIRVFDDVGLTFKKKNVRILNSTGDKISAHWSYLGLSFRNSEEQKVFWKYVEHIIEQSYSDLCFLRTRADNKMELMTVLDIAVYSKNRAMRTIYSHKSGSPRVLMPCKIREGEIKEIQYADPLDYLIYEPDATEYYDLKIPKFEKVRNKFLTKDDIHKLILQHVPNTEISEVSGRMFKLKNVGTRVCIINGEENEGDNSYVVWRRDGLYFACHDVGCEGQMKKICELGSPVQVDKTLTIESFRQMASTCITYDRRKEIEEMLVAWMNERFVLVKANKTFIVEEFVDIDEDDNLCKGVKYKDIKSFLTDFSNKVLKTKLPPEEIEENKHDKNLVFNMISPAQLWLSHPLRREVDKIIFDPKMYFDKPAHQHRYYNLFDGFEISKDDVKDVVVPDDIEEHAFFQHILKRWCKGNKQSYNVVLNMFAHILQKPWEKLQISLILKSTMRTGKGIPLQKYKKIIGGKYFFQPSKVEQVLGSFNGQMKNCLVCFMDEMCWGGDKEKAGTIKKLVTESVNYINEKYTPTIRVKNLANQFMASNEDWVVPAGATEQRWVVLNVDDELATCPKPEKKKIIQDILSLDDRIYARFLYDRDISNWNHRETVNTDGLREQKIQSLPAIHKWWLTCLNKCVIPDEEDNIWNDDGNFGTFVDKDLTYARAEKTLRDKHMNETKFWMEMKRIIGQNYKTKRLMKNKIRRHYIYIPSLEICRSRWMELYNDDGWNWENDDCESDDDM